MNETLEQRLIRVESSLAHLEKLCDDLNRIVDGQPRKKDREFLASKSSQQHTRRQIVPQDTGQTTQHCIAHIMTARVIDGLEVIDVKQDENQRTAAVPCRLAALAELMVE